MPHDTSQAAGYLNDFGSPRERERTPVQALLDIPDWPRFDPRMEAEATYFSRRAREERQAASQALSRKSREVHLELAMAYEFRAHQFTREVLGGAASYLYAL